jgi:YD repeat-containing protein
MTGASSSTQYNPERVSKVELPDGRVYQFRYNSYGELARVELPTGGNIEYDWIDSSGNGEGIIYRRVSERRLYTIGSTLENKTTYSDPGSNGQIVEVRVFDAGSTLLAHSKHYFHGNGLASLGSPLVSDPARSPISYPPWKEGREYQTENFDIVGGTPVLKRRVSHTFQQPLAGANWPLGQPETSGTAKPNNPQVTQSVVTLVDTNQLSKQTFSYDRYSNQTDVVGAHLKV